MFKKRTVGDFQVKRFVGFMPVRFSSELCKIHDEAAHDVCSVLGSLADFLDLANDMPFARDVIVYEGEL